MSREVVAKFKVHVKNQTIFGCGVELNPIMNEDTEENKTFWDATPTGKIEMFLTQKGAQEFFEVNSDYYVVFKKVDKDD